MGRDAACDDDSRSEGEALAGYWAGPEEIWGVPLWSDGLLPCRCSLSVVGQARVKRLVLRLYSAPNIFKVFSLFIFPRNI
jgi:hypothetical protein